MSRNGHITRLEYDTDEGGAAVVLTVRLVQDTMWYAGTKANAADIPPEAADALREWLKSAPTMGEAQG